MAGRGERIAVLGGGARILILAPHPDDEVVACGIAATRAIAALSAHVFVYYLTNGVAAPETLWCWQRRGHAARVERRLAEAHKAASLLGLTPLGHLDVPSRHLRHHLDRAYRAVSEAVADSGADEVWVPAFEGAHQDHDAANALAARFGDRIPVYEFAAYNFANSRVCSNRFVERRGSERDFVATAEEARCKRQALRCYASERGNLRHIGVAAETARPLPVYDYASPPHAGRLFRERFHWVPIRHPRIDFAPSSEVYRDIGAWVVSALARLPRRSPALGEAPGGEPRQAECEFADALDEAER